MIIFGTRGLTSTVSSGVFHCPRCGPQRPYSHQRVKRWFTLYFIPCIPMGVAGEYLECNQCAGTFGVDALHYDPSVDRQKTMDEIKRILVLTAMHAGPMTDTRYVALQSAIAGISDQNCSLQELQIEVNMAQQAQAQMIPYVRHVAGGFSDEGKNAVLTTAYFALADHGQLGAQEEKSLVDLGVALGLAPNIVAGLLERMKQVR